MPLWLFFVLQLVLLSFATTVNADIATSDTDSKTIIESPNCNLNWNDYASYQLLAFKVVNENLGEDNFKKIKILFQDSEMISNDEGINGDIQAGDKIYSTIIKYPKQFGQAKISIRSVSWQDTLQEKLTNCDFTQTSDKIIINEIYPRPSDANLQEEFIELANLDTKPIDLYRWQLDDLLNAGSKPYQFSQSQVINAGEKLILDKTKTKIALNDTGDTIHLIDPSSKIIHDIKYNNALRGQSFNYENQNWYWSEPSAGRENNANQINDIDKARQDDEKNLSEVNAQFIPLDTIFLSDSYQGKIIKTRATIYYEANIFMTGIAIAKDKNQAVLLEIDQPDLRLAAGQEIEFNAQVSNSKQPKLINLTNVKVINDFQSIDYNKINSYNSKRLNDPVEVSGKIIKENNKYFLQADSNMIRLRRRENINFDELKTADTAVIRGIMVSIDPIELKIIKQGDLKVTQSIENLGLTSQIELQKSDININQEQEDTDANMISDQIIPNSTPLIHQPIILPKDNSMQLIETDIENFKERLLEIDRFIEQSFYQNSAESLKPINNRMIMLLLFLPFILIITILGEMLWQNISFKSKISNNFEP